MSFQSHGIDRNFAASQGIYFQLKYFYIMLFFCFARNMGCQLNILIRSLSLNKEEDDSCSNSSIPSPPPPHNLKGLNDRKLNDVHRRRHKNVCVPPMPMKKSDGRRRVETKEERKLRKKTTLLKKTQKQGKGYGSVLGSRMGERGVSPLLNAGRTQNRVEKPTTFSLEPQVSIVFDLVIVIIA